MLPLGILDFGIYRTWIGDFGIKELNFWDFDLRIVGILIFLILDLGI